MVMMALLGLREAVGKRAEVSPGGEDREEFWWTKGTLREELRPCVKARTKEPPTCTCVAWCVTLEGIRHSLWCMIIFLNVL